MRTIKISLDLDYIYIKVDGKIDKRWPMQKDSEGNVSATLLNNAKVAAFDLLWRLTEAYGNAKINPYIN